MGAGVPDAGPLLVDEAHGLAYVFVQSNSGGSPVGGSGALVWFHFDCSAGEIGAQPVGTMPIGEFDEIFIPQYGSGLFRSSEGKLFVQRLTDAGPGMPVRLPTTVPAAPPMSLGGLLVEGDTAHD